MCIYTRVGIFARKIRFVVCLHDPQILNLMKFSFEHGVASAQFDLINFAFSVCYASIFAIRAIETILSKH